MSLTTVLTSIRTTLKTLSVPVYVRDELPVNSDNEYTPPTDAQHIVMDLVSTDPRPGLSSGSLYEGISVQISAWSNASLTSALSLAESARAALVAGNDYDRTGPVILARDMEWRGVIFTISSPASFDSF